MGRAIPRSSLLPANAVDQPPTLRFPPTLSSGDSLSSANCCFSLGELHFAEVLRFVSMSWGDGFAGVGVLHLWKGERKALQGKGKGKGRGQKENPEGHHQVRCFEPLL